MHYRKHIRLPNYDYSQNGYYFVTICTYMRKPIFINAAQGAAGTMCDAAQGAATTPRGGSCSILCCQNGPVNIKSLVEEKIRQIPEYYQGVEVDYNEVMPTHVHMILILHNTNTSLPKIINAFKSWVTRDIKRTLAPQGGAATLAAQGAAATIHGCKIWQPNYYEHIIRDESALNKIREYIVNNPEKEKYDWDELDV